MSGNSNISWTDATWNPVTGCSQVSPGCAHCYAKTLTERFNGPGSFDTVVLHPKRLRLPMSWKKPRRVFVNSMSDLFHQDVPFEFIDRVFAIMALTPQHTYQVLTKRPERMQEYMGSDAEERADAVGEAIYAMSGKYASGDPADDDMVDLQWPIPNVILGVSAENQHWLDQRVPILLDTPAAVRFVSVEPMLGPVGARGYLPSLIPTLRGADRDAAGLDWVIVGAESGPGRRLFDLQWARDLKAQCDAAGVAYFFKQAGGAKPGMASGDPELDAAKAWPRMSEENMSEHVPPPPAQFVLSLGEMAATVRLLGELEEQNAALVRVVEKLLAFGFGAKGHDPYCKVEPCTCGADEARELLARIRGEA